MTKPRPGDLVVSTSRMTSVIEKIEVDENGAFIRFDFSRDGTEHWADDEYPVGICIACVKQVPEREHIAFNDVLYLLCSHAIGWDLSRIWKLDQPSPGNLGDEVISFRNGMKP